MVKNEEKRSISHSNESVESLGEFVMINATPRTSVDALADRIFGDITKASACRQLAIGGVTGWLAGYMGNKVGKMAIVGITSSVILLQLAQYNGYITVDWAKVQHAMTETQAKAKRSLTRHSKSFTQKGQLFYEENFFLASGFAAGFLIGFIW